MRGEEVRLWNAHTGELIKTLTEHKEVVSSVAFSPDGNLIVSGDWYDWDGYLSSGTWSGEIRVWDADTRVNISKRLQDIRVVSQAWHSVLMGRRSPAGGQMARYSYGTSPHHRNPVSIAADTNADGPINIQINHAILTKQETKQ